MPPAHFWYIVFFIFRVFRCLLLRQIEHHILDEFVEWVGGSHVRHHVFQESLGGDGVVAEIGYRDVVFVFQQVDVGEVGVETLGGFLQRFDVPKY